MKQKIVKTESSQLLVSAGKSSRLDAIRKKAGLGVTPPGLEKKQSQLIIAKGLNQATKEALQQASVLIEDKIHTLMTAYPAGKKNAFFKIKYGVEVERVKEMPVQGIFKLLKLEDNKIKHFKMIGNLYLNGKSSDTLSDAEQNS